MTAEQQHPIGSPFGQRSTAAQVMRGVDLAGMTAVVTGGASGIGLVTARALATAGARVIVGARRPDEAAQLVRGMANVRVLPLELMDAASVDAFARGVLELLAREGGRLGLLVESAGIMYAPQRYDERGNESHLSTNFLGHYRLAVRLWPALAAAGRKGVPVITSGPVGERSVGQAGSERGARVVVLTSSGHRHAGVDYADPNFEARPYDPQLAYAQSKTADIQLALALDDLGREQGVRAFAVHPGMVPGTNLGRFMGAGPRTRRAAGFLLNDLRLAHAMGAAMRLAARLGSGRAHHPGASAALPAGAAATGRDGAGAFPGGAPGARGVSVGRGENSTRGAGAPEVSSVGSGGGVGPSYMGRGGDIGPSGARSGDVGLQDAGASNVGPGGTGPGTASPHPAASEVAQASTPSDGAGTVAGASINTGEQTASRMRANLAAPGAEPPYFKTAQQGAASVLWAATSPLLAAGPRGVGGVYIEDCNVAGVAPADSPSPYGVRPWAIDPACVKRTWELAARLTGLTL